MGISTKLWRLRNGRPRARQTLSEWRGVDIALCFSGMSMLTADSVRQLQIHFSQVRASAELTANSAPAAAEAFGFDSVVIPHDVCVIAEAPGLEINFYQDSSEITFPSVRTKRSDPNIKLFPNLFQKNNLTESRATLGKAAVIFGNFDPYRTLVKLGPSDVTAAIRNASRMGSDLWPEAGRKNVCEYVRTVGNLALSALPVGNGRKGVFYHVAQR